MINTWVVTTNYIIMSDFDLRNLSCRLKGLLPLDPCFLVLYSIEAWILTIQVINQVQLPGTRAGMHAKPDQTQQGRNITGNYARHFMTEGPCK